MKALRAALLALFAGVAQAADPQLAGDEIAKSAENSKPVSDEVGFVVLPIPRADPTLGDGLMVTGIVLYNPTGGARPWISGIGGMYTNTDSKAGALMQKAYLMDDKLRLLGVVGQFDLNLQFFGIGANAGNRGTGLPINQSGTAVVLRGLYEVTDKFYVGPSVRYVALKSTIHGPTLPALGITLPDIELDAVTSALGVVAEFDTRDSELNPQRGTFAKVDLAFPREAFGSDFNYEHVAASYNYYLPAGVDKVLAVRASACGVSGDVPFFDLCMFGAGADLRGYVGGQYRDRAMLAVQAEYRWNFHGRWGAVGFVGAGSVAPSWGDIGHSTTLPSYGVGVRFIASKAHKVNISADWARGRDDSAFYVRIGEAF